MRADEAWMPTVQGCLRGNSVSLLKEHDRVLAMRMPAVLRDSPENTSAPGLRTNPDSTSPAGASHIHIDRGIQANNPGQEEARAQRNIALAEDLGIAARGYAAANS